MIYAVMPSPERENDADKISTSNLEMMKGNCLKESSFNCNRCWRRFLQTSLQICLDNWSPIFVSLAHSKLSPPFRESSLEKLKRKKLGIWFTKSSLKGGAHPLLLCSNTFHVLSFHEIKHEWCAWLPYLHIFWHDFFVQLKKFS